MKKRINWNTAGFALLLVVYLFSVYRIFQMHTEKQAAEIEGGKQVVRMLHWQLEPGYRDALQGVMDRYNALPHVRRAGVEVRQLAVPDKAYTQFLNVHMISGTAPDICERGKSKMSDESGGSALFFEPLTDLVEQPNRYNADAYLKDGLSPSERSFLQERPLRETIIGQMETARDEASGDYYEIHLSTFGIPRMAYNADFLVRLKTFLREQIARDPGEAWLASLRPLRAADARWIEQPDAPPQTLGQVFLLGAALEAYGRTLDRPNLSLIAGSRYATEVFYDSYLAAFTGRKVWELDLDWSGKADSFEQSMSLARGQWALDEDPARAYYECMRAISELFPVGFLGLDREQAMRRFISGQSLMIPSAGWDANTILHGSQSQGDPGAQFEVGFIPFPLPAAGERWGEAIAGPTSEVRSVFGTAYGVFKRSANKEWAKDFLAYLSSHPVNERFNLEAGWLPMVEHAEVSPQLRAFRPQTHGFSGRIALSGFGGAIGSLLEGQFLLFVSGETSVGALAGQVAQALDNPQLGARRVWADADLADLDAVKAVERSIISAEYRHFMDSDGGMAVPRDYQVKLRSSLLLLNGSRTRALWQQLNPGEHHPEF
ncbi:MAG: extracellular solute-binding protein [Opitutales bacterium]